MFADFNIFWHATSRRTFTAHDTASHDKALWHTEPRLFLKVMAKKYVCHPARG